MRWLYGGVPLYTEIIIGLLLMCCNLESCNHLGLVIPKLIMAITFRTLMTSHELLRVLMMSI